LFQSETQLGKQNTQQHMAHHFVLFDCFLGKVFWPISFAFFFFFFFNLTLPHDNNAFPNSTPHAEIASNYTHTQKNINYFFPKRKISKK